MRIIFKAYCIAILFLAPLFGDTYPISQFFNVLINDSKVGYSSVITERSEYEKKACLKETTFMFFEIKRFKDSIKMETRTELYFTEKLEPLYFKTYENLTGQEHSMEGKVSKGKIFVTDKFAGKEVKKEFKLPAGTIFGGMVDDYLRRSPILSDNRLELSVFDSSMMGVSNVKIKIHDLVKQKIGKKEYICYAIDIEMYNIITNVFIDEDGFTVRSVNPQMGLEEVLTTEEDAKKAFSASVDILSDFAIKANRVVERSSDVKEMNCSLVFDKGFPPGLTKDTIAKTSIMALTDNIAVCALRRVEFPEEKAIDLPVKEKEVQKYLKATPYEQAEDAAIKKAAFEVVGAEKNTLKAAKLIVKWVNKYVKTKDFSSAFATAKETFDSKQGDCKGHSVLASSFCKAVGIPVKIAAGIYPINDRFYYHMWIEVYAGNGKWVPMDPTFNQTVLDAAHIKLTEGTLDDEGKIAFMTDVYKYFKSMEVVIFKLEYLDSK